MNLKKYIKFNDKKSFQNMITLRLHTLTSNSLDKRCSLIGVAMKLLDSKL
jgi:hypothetical protein